MDLDKFCDVNFDGLKSYVSWQRFYAYLVSVMISIWKKEELEDLPDITKVVVPEMVNIKNCARLIYHNIGKLRVALADGQHRMGAIMEMVGCGYRVEISSGGHHRGGPTRRFVKQMRADEGLVAINEKITESLSSKVTTRVVTILEEIKSPSDFELCCIGYSKMREKSQLDKKPRVLRDA